jgi:acyl carrier protein
MTSSDPVTEFIQLHRPELTELDPDLDLIDNRIIDSLMFVEFIYYLESLTGEQLEIESITVDDFRTLRAIRKRFLGEEWVP